MSVALLHEAGRSSGLPVQLPLLPAPLPPLVGGDGLANAAGAIVAPSAAVARSAAKVRRVLLIGLPPL